MTKQDKTLRAKNIKQRKDCKTCKHRECESTQEPCYACFTATIAYTKWEPAK